MDTTILVLQWFVTLILIGGGFFLRSYLIEKGKNLATKEDVARITEEMERIRHQYAAQLEVLRASLDMRSQLRLAAAEKRLEKHQEAFVLWNKLLRKAHDSDLPNAVVECQEWWIANNIYLDAEARTSFRRAFGSAMTFHQLRRDGDVETRMKLWDHVQAAGAAIVEGVALPSLGRDEVTDPELNEPPASS